LPPLDHPYPNVLAMRSGVNAVSGEPPGLPVVAIEDAAASQPPALPPEAMKKTSP
jgi:hypothetical protein